MPDLSQLLQPLRVLYYDLQVFAGTTILMRIDIKRAKNIRTLLCCGCLIVALQSAAVAQRFWQPMGQYIRQSAAIALVDTKEIPSPDNGIVLQFREFLKPSGNGPPSMAALALRCSVLFEAPYVPPNAAGIAVLLAKGWNHATCPVLAAYEKPEEIAALRVFVKIYDLPSERAQLEALRALVNDPNRLFRKQLFDDLGQMHGPANFQIIPDLYESLDVEGQADLLDVIKSIGDLRAVPILLKALQSQQSSLCEKAARILELEFRSASGVDEALRQYHARTPVLPENTFQAAERLWKTKERPRSRSLFVAIAANPKETDYARTYSALKVASSLTSSERATLQSAMGPLLKNKVQNGSYPELLDVAKILRALRTPDNLDLLVSILERKQGYGVDGQTPCIAATAIRELGAPAQSEAAEELLNHISTLPSSYQDTADAQPQLLALAWLGNEKQWKQIDSWKWGPLQPLLGAGQQRDEGLFLVYVLQDHPNLPSLALEWIAFRLGDLRDKRAAPELLRLVTQDYSSAVDIEAQALMRIGGPAVEAGSTKLLTDPKRGVRVSAIEILCHLQRTKVLPLLRRMISEQDFGPLSKGVAITTRWLSGSFGIVNATTGIASWKSIGTRRSSRMTECSSMTNCSKSTRILPTCGLRTSWPKATWKCSCGRDSFRPTHPKSFQSAVTEVIG